MMYMKIKSDGKVFTTAIHSKLTHSNTRSSLKRSQASETTVQTVEENIGTLPENQVKLFFNINY